MNASETVVHSHDLHDLHTSLGDGEVVIGNSVRPEIESGVGSEIDSDVEMVTGSSDEEIWSSGDGSPVCVSVSETTYLGRS